MMQFPITPSDDTNRHFNRALMRYGFLSFHQNPENSGLSKVVAEYFENILSFDIQNFNTFSEEEILNYLLHSHDLYLYKYIPEIEQTIHLLVTASTEKQPQLLLLSILFKDYTSHLEEHINFENKQLFPVVKRYLNSENDSKSIHYSALADFYAQHSDTEKDLKFIHSLMDNFDPCIEQKSLFEILKSQIHYLELDLMIHSKMEEEVLMPRILNSITQ